MISGNTYFRPVIPLVISMMLGVFFCSRFPEHQIIAYFLIVFTAGFIFLNIIKKKSALILPLFLFFAAGYLLIHPWIAPNFSPDHVINFADSSSKYLIAGTVADEPVRIGKRLKFVLKNIIINKNSTSYPVSGHIRVTMHGSKKKISSGDHVKFKGKIRKVRNFNNPGGFNYERYMAFRKIWATSYVSEYKLFIKKSNTQKEFLSFVKAGRQKIVELIEKSADPYEQRDEQAVLKALIVGEKNSMPQYLRQSFNKAGLGHILAISGLHIGIVAGVSFFIFNAFFVLFKPLLLNGLARKLAAFSTLVPVLSYGLIAGMSASTQRAVIMVSFFLFTFIFEREQDIMNTVALAAMLILVVFPPALFSISFQLSFAAVISIIYGISKTKNIFKLSSQENNPRSGQENNPRPGRQNNSKTDRLKIWFISFLMVSFFAIMGSLPLVACYFNRVSLYGLFANILVVPLIGFIVVPLGLFSVILYPVNMSVSILCMKASAIILSPALKVVRYISDLPFASVITVTPSFFEICCYYLFCWAVLNLLPDKNVHKDPDEAENCVDAKIENRKKFAAGMLVFVIICGCGDLLYWLNCRFWHKDLRATVIDVGMGSATLLELPGGYCILIDGGGFSDNSIFDVGERIVAPLLLRKKIKTVDTLILSHPNSDHLNGLLFIAKNFNVKNFWSNNEKVNTAGYKKLIRIIKENRINFPEFEDIERSRNINGVKLDILYPLPDFTEKKGRERWRDTNNNSMVVRFQLGEYSLLIPGDIEAKAEKELVGMAKNSLQSTILIAPHHGSRTSSTRLFIEKVNPEITVFSAGFNNRFNFPDKSVLKRYQDKGCQILRTDYNGAVMISTDGSGISVRTKIPLQKR